ncbi:hypothetical protein TKK_0011883 [Trichogramma kaykai]|uniref:Uncharacterized protein n=1 Tax=Trichogramma kaykai TaxID=54128 RepID=A0ABD2WPE3_9HYME
MYDAANAKIDDDDSDLESMDLDTLSHTKDSQLQQQSIQQQQQSQQQLQQQHQHTSYPQSSKTIPVQNSASKSKTSSQTIPVKPKSTNVPTNNNIPSSYSDANNGPFIIFIEPIATTTRASQLNLTSVGRIISSSCRGNLISISSSGKSKITVTLTNRISADKLLSDNLLYQNGLKASIPHHRLFRQGIIREVPKDISVNMLLNMIDSPFPITNIKRLQRNTSNGSNEIQLVDTNSIQLTFEGQSLPSCIKLFSVIHEVEPYITPTKMCHNCFRYGHIKSLCKSKALCIHCGNKQHDPDNESDICPKYTLNLYVSTVKENIYPIIKNVLNIFFREKSMNMLHIKISLSKKRWLFS